MPEADEMDAAGIPALILRGDIMRAEDAMHECAARLRQLVVRPDREMIVPVASVDDAWPAMARRDLGD